MAILGKKSDLDKKKMAIRGLKAENALLQGKGDKSLGMFGRRSTVAGVSRATLTTGAGKRKKATENYK